jgi:hypothetical protein
MYIKYFFYFRCYFVGRRQRSSETGAIHILEGHRLSSSYSWLCKRTLDLLRFKEKFERFRLLELILAIFYIFMSIFEVVHNPQEEC